MKKLLSVFLAIVMIFTITVPAFAAEGDAVAENSYDGNPVIIVRGIDFAGLTYENGEKALNVSAGTIFSALMDGFLGALKLKDSQSVLDGVFLAAKEIFDPIVCDKDGNPYMFVSMKQYPESMASYPEFVEELPDGGEEGIVKTAVEKYGAENTYFFTYDWRKTPEQIAGELNGFVETAKENSGKDKVNIICASMGGMVTTAYIEKYGYEIFDSLAFFSPALNGVDVVGSAFTGDLTISGQDLTEFLIKKVGGNFFVDAIIKILDFVFGIVRYGLGIDTM